MILININITGASPLHFAAQEGHADCVTILINNGAEVNTKDNQGYNINVSSLNSLFLMK